MNGILYTQAVRQEKIPCNKVEEAHQRVPTIVKEVSAGTADEFSRVIDGGLSGIGITAFGGGQRFAY